jgi:deoxycytidylate deaminase
MSSRQEPAIGADGLLALDGPELVFGLVGAVGCDLATVSSYLSDALERATYKAKVVRVSHLLHQLDKYEPLQRLNRGSEYERIKRHMEAGTELRSIARRGDVTAWLVIAAIRELRELHHQDGSNGDRGKIPLPRTAFIIQSIKHPAEIKTLRDVYGRAFFLISAYAPREMRVDALARQIAQSEGESDASRFRHQAEQLIQIDEQEDHDFGQSVRDSFPLGDVFIDTRSRRSMGDGINRFVDGVFADPFITPTRDEFGMYHAFAASLRSADLGRQVGASIASTRGEILCVGCNDVPKANGGLYWTDDSPDHRDFREGYDSTERFKKAIAVQLVQKLQKAGWSPPDDIQPSDKVAASLVDKKGPLKGTPILSLLEFGRAVHAEMAAIVYAADRGVGIHGATMFATTFPCHLCARHIVASGLQRVVYIEPYPKSQAEELYKDSLVVDPSTPADRKVAFEPFVGIAPSLYMWMFKNPDRKSSSGDMVKWSISAGNPKLKRFVASYMLIEAKVLGELLPAKLDEIGIKPVS